MTIPIAALRPDPSKEFDGDPLIRTLLANLLAMAKDVPSEAFVLLVGLVNAFAAETDNPPACLDMTIVVLCDLHAAMLGIPAEVVSG